MCVYARTIAIYSTPPYRAMFYQKKASEPV